MSATSWELLQDFLRVFLSKVPCRCRAHSISVGCFGASCRVKAPVVQLKVAISSLISLFLLTHPHYCPR